MQGSILVYSEKKLALQILTKQGITVSELS